jgi:hypothetical protein
MENNKDILGFLKYEGELVAEGYMDAKKSAQALLGFDKAIRFFMFQQEPLLKKTDFEIPVRVKRGSWEIEIPDLIENILLAGGLFAGTTYVKKAAEKMAEHDFENVGFKDIPQKALLALLWMIKIGKHLGDLTIKQFSRTKFRDKNKMIGIRNSEDSYLFVPKNILDLYIASPPNLLVDLSQLVEEHRSLLVGVYEKGDLIEESVTKKDRRIFTQEEEELTDVLFPELDHGQKVVLEGEVTRGNKGANSIGFKYEGHILSCYPQSGSIVTFKHCLFLECRISGNISRLEENGGLGARRPKILFTDIIPVENERDDLSLFK